MKSKFKIPGGLEPEAASFMRKVVAYLTNNNQLEDVDEGALTMLARDYSLYIKASKDIDQNGLISKGSRGNDIPNPSIKIANDSQIQALKIMEKFGLTAKDRAKMSISTDDDEESPLMQFINGDKETR